MHDDPLLHDTPDETNALARAVQAGDTARFEALYERLLPALIAWASIRIPRGRANVDDFLQEVWYRALRNLHTVAAQSHSFRAWIFVIAKNVLLELLRAKGRPEPGLFTGVSSIARKQHDPTTTSSSRLARDETFAQLMEFADSLDRADRNLLLLCGFEGRPAAAVAAQLDLTPDGAQKRWLRLRERLRGFGWLRRLSLEE
jgi:RNA polymerase sigma factor (sigma-70 family)